MSWLARLTRPRCPPGWKLTRAVSEAADPRTEWHVLRCARCAAEYHALQELAQEAKAAARSPEKLSHETYDALGARLRTLALASAPGAAPWRFERPARHALIGLALVVPAIVTAIFWMERRADHEAIALGRPEAPVAAIGDSRATIRAIGPARFSRAQFQPDEIVRVDDGEIELEIAPLHAQERFRVVTDDGEVEVRGTRFKVSVIDHHLSGVHVWHGQVEVRSSGGALAVLRTGDDWVREAPRAAAPPETETTAPPPASEPDEPNRSRVAKRRALPAVKRHAKTLAALTPPPKPLPAARDRRRLAGPPSFGHAWSLLRSGDARAAATEFAEVERLAHGSDIEEDALYWRAVAVGRGGDAPGARTLFAAFLDRFPSSSRAGEAAAALGRLLLEAGDRNGARQAFERAARDPSPQVRAVAQDGLGRAQEPEQQGQHEPEEDR